MAITVITQPETHTPAYNHQNFEFSSTNTAQTNFTLSCAVRVDAYQGGVVTSGDTITDEIDPRPSDSRVHYNPQRTVESYVHPEFFPTITDFQQSIDGAISRVLWSVQEKYGSPPTLQGTLSSGYYYVWNSAYQTKDFASFTYSTSTVAKDLTLVPSLNDTIHYDQKYLMKTWHRGFSTRDLRYLSLTCYNSAGATVQDAVLENASYDTTVANTIVGMSRNHITFNCSPEGFNSYTGAITSQSVVGDLVPSTTAYYSFFFYPANPLVVSSNTYTVTISDFCNKGFTRYVLHFLNRLGNFDSYTFHLLSEQSAEKKTLDYKKLLYTPAVTPQGYYIYDRDEKNYSTLITNKITVNSDWLTDAKAIWLKDLVMSPVVYLETVGSSDLMAVKITDTSYKTSQKVNQRLTSLTLQLEYSFEDIRQRG